MNEILGSIFVLAIVGLSIGAIALLVRSMVQTNRERLKHEREMAMIKAGNIPANNEEIDKLRERCDALEKRCTKLEDQLTDAHALLSDEQRQLDRKLASILPGEGAPAPTHGQMRTKTIQ